jgi:hypothetical protein
MSGRNSYRAAPWDRSRSSCASLSEPAAGIGTHRNLSGGCRPWRAAGRSRRRPSSDTAAPTGGTEAAPALGGSGCSSCLHVLALAAEMPVTLERHYAAPGRIETVLYCTERARLAEPRGHNTGGMRWVMWRTSVLLSVPNSPASGAISLSGCSDRFSLHPAS